VEVIGPVAPGAGVQPAGSLARPGRVLLERSRIVAAAALPLLVAAGVGCVPVHRRPVARLVVATGEDTGDGLMLAALVARDGATVETREADGEDGLARALAEPGADLVIIVGRSGFGRRDVAPLALARAGSCAIHGVALQPGTSAALGRVGAAMVLITPGAPAECFASYVLLGRAIVRGLAGRGLAGRGLAGRDPGAGGRRVVLARKIVSEAGFTELVPIRLGSGGATAVASAATADALALAQAEGFAVLAEAVEGLVAGAEAATLDCA
ncbi:MAG: molybdopterin-binding protein, partial [Alphaproteobacteria bacterium]